MPVYNMEISLFSKLPRISIMGGNNSITHTLKRGRNLRHGYVHSVSYVYAVLPFYDVKCLC